MRNIDGFDRWRSLQPTATKSSVSSSAAFDHPAAAVLPTTGSKKNANKLSSSKSKGSVSKPLTKSLSSYLSTQQERITHYTTHNLPSPAESWETLSKSASNSLRSCSSFLASQQQQIVQHASNIPLLATASVESLSYTASSVSSVLSSQQRRLTELSKTFNKNDNFPCESACIVSGIITFGSTLAISTVTQGKVLHVSTGTPGILPTFFGFTTVCLASIASNYVATTIHQQWKQQQPYLLSSSKQGQSKSTTSSRFLRSQSQKDTNDMINVKGYFQIPLHTIRVCCVGLLMFKLLGGRFWAIAPSSYTHVGSFARTRASLPATERYATTVQRNAIEQLGRRFGCHTCGSRMIVTPLFKKRPTSSIAKFVGDHMPPKVVAEQMNSRWWRQKLGLRVKYRFYPQCIHCSSKQGSILSKAAQELKMHHSSLAWLTKGSSNKIPDLSQAGGGANAYIHAKRPRINHLAGGIVAAIAVVGNPSDDRQRYKQIQNHVQSWLSQTYSDICRILPDYPKSA